MTTVSSFMIDSTIFSITSDPSTIIDLLTTSSIPNTTVTPLYEKCMQALQYSQDLELNIGEILKCALSFTILFLLLFVGLQYKKKKLAAHGNFFVLICNLILLYLIESLGILFLEIRCQIIYRVQTDPCQLLTSPWLATALMIHSYIYFVGYTLTHLAISTERIKAIFYSRSYEKEDLKYSFSCIFIVWFMTIAINVIIVCLAFQDDAFSQPLVHVTLTTKSNTSFLLNLQYFLLALVILTSLMDCFATFVNKRHRARINSLELTSNLSEKYQVNENTITMRLVLPLDISYSVFFILYLCMNTLLRKLQNSFTPVEVAALFKIIYSLLPLHSIVSILLYIRFVNINKSKAVFRVELDKQTKLYFKQLDTQWACHINL